MMKTEDPTSALRGSFFFFGAICCCGKRRRFCVKDGWNRGIFGQKVIRWKAVILSAIVFLGLLSLLSLILNRGMMGYLIICPPPNRNNRAFDECTL